MFKSIADIKKAMVVGSSWHCLHHGTTSQPTKKDMGTRKVTVVQSNSFAFESLNNPGSNSWCDWPKKANVIFHEGDSFTITESGRPLLTYTKVTPVTLPAPPAEINIDPDLLKQPVKPATPANNPSTATSNKGANAMNATKKQLIALASNINRIMSLNETDAINVNEKTATVATLTDAIKDLSGEFTTADFDPATAEEFRFSEEDVKTLSLIGIEPPKPVVTRRATVGGKKVRKAKANNGNATPKADLYTRSHSFVDAVKHGGTKDDIVKLSDKLYREKNPNAKPEGAKKPLFVAEVMFRYAMPSLLLLGAVVTGKNGEGKEVFNLSSDNPDAIKKPVTPAKSATPAKK